MFVGGVAGGSLLSAINLTLGGEQDYVFGEKAKVLITTVIAAHQSYNHKYMCMFFCLWLTSMIMSILSTFSQQGDSPLSLQNIDMYYIRTVIM